MPKEAAYTLAWSETHHLYILSDRRAGMTLPCDEASPQWRAWLEQASSFAFRGHNGTFTARKEQVKPGDWYWYAYQRTQKRVRKKYLGKDTALSLQRLEQMAAYFASGSAEVAETASGTAPVQLVQTAQEQILAAKLRAPLPPRHLVARGRLLRRLEKATEYPLTLLAAPAGSGKSTLLSNWLQESAAPSAWLSLDQGDNEPARFWSHVFTTLETLYPGAGERALHLLASLRTPTVERVLTLLINLLGSGIPTMHGVERQAFLVLDDYHVISAAVIHQDMAFLLEHLPPHLHVILSTRYDPPLPLVRWQVANRLLELRPTDLCFAGEEIAAFFAQQARFTLAPDELALLEKRTDGWAAGLQLVALLLQDQQERPDLSQLINSSQASLAEYLGQEILAHLPEHLQHFLLTTSILEQLEGQLCEAVSEQAEGEKTLAQLFQMNFFLTSLDETRRWYRYHQVFAELLRRRLQQVAAAQIPRLHRRAYRWYREQGMLAEAVAHARAGEDWESIADIAEDRGMELMSSGETRMVMNWVALLPRALVFSRLRLFLFECWYHWYTGQASPVLEMFREYTRQHALPDLAAEDATLVDQAICAHVEKLYPRTAWSAEQQANRKAEMLALYGVLCMQRTEGVAFSQALCQRAVAYVAGLMHRARIVQHLGTVLMLQGKLGEATAVLEDALDAALVDGSATWIASIGYRLGMLYEMMGQLRSVVRVAQKILHMARDKIFLTRATAFIFLGNVEYERNNLEAAARFFHLAISACEEVNLLKELDPYMHLLLGHLYLARIQLIKRDIASARQNLASIADYLAHNWVGTEVHPVVKGEYALLIAQLGDESAGRQWLEEFPPPEQSEQMLLRQLISLNPRHHLIYARVLFSCQRWQEAAQMARQQQALAERQERTGNLIQWLTLRALVHHVQNETDPALAAITRATSLAEAEGYTRIFLDAGTPLLALLHRLRHALRTQSETADAVPTPGYVERLILLLHREQRAEAAVGEDAELFLVEPLSEREREVLWHLSAGRSNREIAEQLIIAPSTVKSHVRAIYGKLGVTSRTQALARVRNAGQFPPSSLQEH